ncbi:hypothetical protein [uncultured Microscilla sp.]|uniref:hypothetical protein n=1 Tax=uncultured Microscilla sp. TaxID=432653 RepID=UPI00262DC4DB|nr:hypothetical protein [uncultured Microscilla sp.]
MFYTQEGTPVAASLQVKHLQAGAGQWQELELSYTATERGYLQVFAANESDQTVFFDDMVVEHTPQLIVQENHYYPFGLELEGLSKNGKPEHRWKFQGQEEQKEFGLNWSSFKWRNADVALGRFFSVDPLAEDYLYNSTYAFSENKVTGDLELEGLESVPGYNNSMNYMLLNQQKATSNPTKNTAAKRQTVQPHGGYPSKRAQKITEAFQARTKANLSKPNPHKGDYAHPGLYLFEIGRYGKIGLDYLFTGAGAILGEGPNAVLPDPSAIGAVSTRSLKILGQVTEHVASDGAITVTRIERLAKNGRVIVGTKGGAKGMFGAKGAATPSKTVKQWGKTSRIDIENPAPGIRPGQLHYQDANNVKYMYKDGKFYSRNPNAKGSVWDVPAPHVDKLIDKQVGFKDAIKKGLGILGEL